MLVIDAAAAVRDLLQQYRHYHSPCSVLVAEDDPSSRALRQVLKKEDFEVAQAENGHVALERVARSRPCRPTVRSRRVACDPPRGRDSEGHHTGRQTAP